MNRNHLTEIRQSKHIKMQKAARQAATLKFRQFILQKIAEEKTDTHYPEQIPTSKLDESRQKKLSEEFYKFKALIEQKLDDDRGEIKKQIKPMFKQLAEKQFMDTEVLKIIILILDHPAFCKSFISQSLVDTVIDQLRNKRSLYDLVAITQIITKFLSLRDDLKFTHVEKFNDVILATNVDHYHCHQIFYLACISSKTEARPKMKDISQKLYNTFLKYNQEVLKLTVLEVVKGYMNFSNPHIAGQCTEILNKFVGLILLGSQKLELSIQNFCVQLMIQWIWTDSNEAQVLLNKNIFDKIIFLSKISSPELTFRCLTCLCSFILYYDLSNIVINERINDIVSILNISLCYSEYSLLSLVLRALTKILCEMQDSEEGRNFKIEEIVDVRRIDELQRHESREVYEIVTIFIQNFLGDKFVERGQRNEWGTRIIEYS